MGHNLPQSHSLDQPRRLHASGSIRRSVLVEARGLRREMVHGGGGADGMQQKVGAVGTGSGWVGER